MHKILSAAAQSLLGNAEKQFELANAHTGSASGPGGAVGSPSLYQAHMITGMLCRCYAQALIAARDEAMREGFNG